MADHGPDIRADTRWLSYEEAGHVLGIDPDSVARRARRLKWPRLPGNDGKARVAVPADVLPASGPDAAPDQGADGAADKEPYSPRDRGGHVRPDESRTIKALEDEAAALREALARERERADRAEAQAAAALAMADRRVLSALAPTDGMAAILLPPLPLKRNKALNRTPLLAAEIADLRPLGAKSDRTPGSARPRGWTTSATSCAWPSWS